MTNAINGTGSNAASGLNLNPPEVQSRGSLGQKDFLRLMVAQARNQDPMEPQANGEFLSQLAQFSTNDGVTKMQESLQQMASSLQSNQALQASSLVGQKVLVNSDKISLGSDGDAQIAVDFPSGMSDLTASIYSEKGELIRTIPIAKPAVGFYQFPWDGKAQNGERAAAGKYKIEVRGTYSGKPAALKTMTSANVDSVSLGQNGEGLKLNVAGVGSVSLDQIRQIQANNIVKESPKADANNNTNSSANSTTTGTTNSSTNNSTTGTTTTV